MRLPVASSNRCTSDGSGFNLTLSPGLELVPLAEHRDDLLAADLREHLGLRAGRLDHDDLGLGAVVSDGDMLGPHAVDDGPAVGLGRRASPSGSLTPFGPSKPATPFARAACP